MLKAIVVDDEYPARKELRYILQLTQQVEVVAEFEGGEEALAYIDKVSPDVVFLDIRMQGSDGLRVAELINARTKPPRIVFTTGFSEYAARAFELNAENYVMKPYAPERLQAVVQRLIDDTAEKAMPLPHKVAASFKRLTVWHQDRMVVINPDDILFIKADGIHLAVTVTKQANFASRQSLREWEERLGGSHFMRVHKSFLVNMDQISEISPWFNSTYLLSINHSTETIPVGRKYLKDFCRIMKI